MKKFTTLLLVLALTLSTLLSVVPFSAFAETTATEITESLTGYGGGIRKKSDGSVMFSPYIYELRSMMDEDATLTVGELTIEMTFTLLDGAEGEEVYTFNTVSAAVNQGGNKYYFDVYLNGSKGNSGFCPTAEAYYNVDVEIYRGTSLILYGTYPSLQAAAAIKDSSYYNPTAVGGAPVEPPVEPDEPEINYPITIVDTTTYRGFRKNSSGNILFCPYLSSTLDKDGSTLAAVAVKNNASNYTASLEIYYQVGGIDGTELVEVASLTDVAIKSSSNGNYLDIELLKSGLDYGFCPVAGAYYTVKLNILDGEGNPVFCDGLYEDVSTYEVELSSYYYSSEVFYAGAQTGDSAIRFVGGVSEAAAAIYDKVDLQVSFTGDGVARTFTAPTTSVYQTLKGSKNGQVFNAVTVYGSCVEAEETVDAAYLFGYAVTDVPEGTYTVTITPIAYVGETAVEGKVATYTSVTVAANGTVTLTK